MAQKISRRTVAKAIVQKMIAGEHMQSLVKLIAAYLVAHNMVNQTDMLLGDIAYELSQQKKHLYIKVTSAHDLSEAVKKEIAAQMGSRYHISDVEVASDIDDSLVGGVVISTPNEALDLSVRAKLRRLQQV